MQTLIELTPGDPSTRQPYHLIGAGSFAYVFRSLAASEPHVIKIPSKNDPHIRYLYGEEFKILHIIRAHSHPNIIQFIHGIYNEQEGDFLASYFMLELVNGSDLHVQINNWKKRGLFLPPILLYELLLGIAMGMRHLHENCSIIHRDIKLENILLHITEEKIIPKITDFGLSCQITSFNEMILSERRVGTRQYMAPESFRFGQYFVRSDVYSFAVLMFVMATFILPHNPFGADNETIKKIMTAVSIGGRQEIPFFVDTHLKKMIHDCWAPEPQNRPFASEIENCLIERLIAEPKLSHHSTALTRIPDNQRVFTKWNRPFGIFSSSLSRIPAASPSQAGAVIEEVVTAASHDVHDVVNQKMEP